MKRLICVQLAFAAALLGLACVPFVKQGKSKDLSAEEAQKLVTTKTAEDPYLRSQKDVSLEARLARPGALQVTIQNKTTHPLLIGPKFFAVLTPPSKKPIPPTGQSQHLFPLGDVAPGDQVSGELAFPAESLGPNSRLIFNHPECQPAMAKIR